MRPVRLDLTGFASFREPAVVDFTDADYFALVGPTGSGKSTVIDAMTFALYGSAPRWGKVNAIADALAPTANRCTVRLVFDLGPARYVVAREVRRSGKSVMQKNVVLERLLDPNGTGIDGEPSEVVAGDLKEVNRSIEKLLGLSFSDFCQCIVLPQGQFAEFLKATPKDRQEILLKLLGAGHYEAIARSATARAGLAGEKTAILGAQLGGLAEATEDAETAARDREIELTALTTTVEKTLPVIAEAADRVESATAEHRRLVDEQARLTAERVPDGIAALQTGLDDAERARGQAVEQESAIGQADTVARAALAAGPSRSRLETIIGRQQELAGLTARRPAVAEAEAATARQQDQAETVRRTAEQAVTQARDGRDRARQAQVEARTADESLRQRRSLFAAVRTPDGIGALGARTLAARQALQTAGSRREQAETAEQQARDALRQAPARGPLEKARADLVEAELIGDRISALAGELEALRTGLDRGSAAMRTGRTQLDTAQAQYAAITETRTAAALRPHLRTGHACPVCEQTVVTLPAPLPDADLDAARDEVTRAENELRRVSELLAEATRQVAAKEGEIRSAEQYLTKLTASLEGRPTDVETLVAQLSRLDDLETAMDGSVRESAAARDAERRASRALDELAEQTAAARAQLLATHGPLISSGAPVLDDTDLPSAWATLTDWTTEQVAELDDRLLPSSRIILSQKETAYADAVQKLQGAERELQAAQTAHTESVRAATRAAGEQRALTARLAELESLLVDAPSPEQAAEQLELCTRLADDARRTGEDLIRARSVRAAAERDCAQWETKAVLARKHLSAARDRLVALGAPELDGASVAAGWTGLLSWAHEQAGRRAAALPEVAQRIDQARREHDTEVRSLRELMAEHAVDLDPDEAPGVLPARMATALERARAETRMIAEKRSQAASLTEKMAAAAEEQQVAKLLADLLRFDRFPRWLAAAALDTLVIDASAALSDLSGGQFDLSHDRGEFVVIDHADADSRRSVRTLSGGETFQASLALALALSAQLSTLAAEGAARLDSIFLDEGFGTLDPETLEVVAGTLENLARGERMVGVITHVAALAERAPVRFAVHRDNRTSSIVREGV
jgi:exonuclease SbcC